MPPTTVWLLSTLDIWWGDARCIFQISISFLFYFSKIYCYVFLLLVRCCSIEYMETHTESISSSLKAIRQFAVQSLGLNTIFTKAKCSISFSFLESMEDWLTIPDANSNPICINHLSDYLDILSGWNRQNIIHTKLYNPCVWVEWKKHRHKTKRRQP